MNNSDSFPLPSDPNVPFTDEQEAAFWSGSNVDEKLRELLRFAARDLRSGAWTPGTTKRSSTLNPSHSSLPTPYHPSTRSDEIEVKSP